MNTNKQVPNKFFTILNCKCPRCRQGKIFPYSAYNLAKFTKMNERCPTCDLKFEKEPGFFVGAMYFGYAISIASFVTVAVAITVLSAVLEFSATTTLYIVSIITATLLLVPFNFRYSRVMMIHFFGGEQTAYNHNAPKISTMRQ
jgi:uncharacterized protein (DUF983 family)